MPSLLAGGEDYRRRWKMSRIEQRLKESRECGTSSRGKTCFEKHLTGGRLTQREAILAKCYDCTCFHIDGRIDCAMHHCPLYPWMPYREKKRKERADGKAVA
jgi:hypothetical protein